VHCKAQEEASEFQVDAMLQMLQNLAMASVILATTTPKLAIGMVVIAASQRAALRSFSVVLSMMMIASAKALPNM
jgi:hypothetical protein